jgi:hypothetical protein
MSEEKIEQTFNVTAPAHLKISNIRGSVTVQAGEAGIIAVSAVKHDGSGSRTEVYIAQAEDGKVLVETRHPDGIFSFFSFSHPCRVDYVVHAPAGTVLNVSCVSSSLAVEGLEGEFDLHTVSGAVDLNALSGLLKINSVSGDVSGAGLSGALQLETVSGDVRLGEANLPSAEVSTVSGNITLQTPLAGGPYHFNSVSGDVQFVVPDGTSCSAELSSISGSIRSTLPFTASRGKGNHRTVEIQGGGTKVYLNSVSGDLRIGRVGDDLQAATVAVTSTPIPPIPPIPSIPPIPPVQPIPAAPTTPSTPKLTRAEILEKIERGEMTVDEGIKLFNEQ